jgi:hypothetical protein
MCIWLILWDAGTVLIAIFCLKQLHLVQDLLLPGLVFGVHLGNVVVSAQDSVLQLGTGRMLYRIPQIDDLIIGPDKLPVIGDLVGLLKPGELRVEKERLFLDVGAPPVQVEDFPLALQGIPAPQVPTQAQSPVIPKGKIIVQEIQSGSPVTTLNKEAEPGPEFGAELLILEVIAPSEDTIIR